MNSSEPDSDRQLRDRVRALPIPETPLDLEARVRRRLRLRRVRRGALEVGTALAIVVALLTWRPWTEVGRPPPVVQQPKPSPVARATPTPREIPTDDLAVLFAPPPVDRLTILDRRDRGTVAALTRMEGVK